MALALSVAAIGCNRPTVSHSEQNGRDVKQASAPEYDRDKTADASITVSGCLQRGPGSSYLLTRVNEPQEKGVGTTGSPGAVEREQLRMASGTYRIKPNDDVHLDDVVGKEVRVVGTIEQSADLPRPAAQDNSKDRADIDAGDVTSVRAVSLSIVNETCHGAESGLRSR